MTYATNPVPLAHLDRAVSHAAAAQKAALTAQYLATPGAATPDEAAQASSYAKTAAEEASAAVECLTALGGELKPVTPAVPIDLLQLDTPDTRRLLTLLEEAQAVAERIDLARGRALPEEMPLQPGESRGTDLAESVSYLALRVRLEVCGPGGRD